MILNERRRIEREAVVVAEIPEPRDLTVRERVMLRLLMSENVSIEELAERTQVSIDTLKAVRKVIRQRMQVNRSGNNGRIVASVEFAARILDAWAAILPMRVNKEELGDYIEDIHRRADRGQRWLLWLRVITAIIWTGINAVGYVTKNLLGKQTTK